MDTNDLIAARTRAEYAVDELRAKNVQLRAALIPLVEAADVEARLARHFAKDMTPGAARVKIEYALGWETKRDAGMAALGVEQPSDGRTE